MSTTPTKSHSIHGSSSSQLSLEEPVESVTPGSTLMPDSVLRWIDEVLRPREISPSAPEPAPPSHRGAALTRTPNPPHDGGVGWGVGDAG